jgi:hypothetical protein
MHGFERWLFRFNSFLQSSIAVDLNFKDSVEFITLDPAKKFDLVGHLDTSVLDEKEGVANCPHINPLNLRSPRPE